MVQIHFDSAPRTKHYFRNLIQLVHQEQIGKSIDWFRVSEEIRLRKVTNNLLKEHEASEAWVYNDVMKKMWSIELYTDKKKEFEHPILQNIAQKRDRRSVEWYAYNNQDAIQDAYKNGEITDDSIFEAIVSGPFQEMIRFDLECTYNRVKGLDFGCHSETVAYGIQENMVPYSILRNVNIYDYTPQQWAEKYGYKRIKDIVLEEVLKPQKYVIPIQDDEGYDCECHECM